MPGKKTVRSPRATTVVVAALLLVAFMPGIAASHPDHDETAPGKNVPVPDSEAERQLALVSALERADLQAALEPIGLSECVGGNAAGYPCDGVDLLAFLPLSTLGGGDGNDIWGWTDPGTARDFVIMGRTSGVTFVEITNPTKPKVVGTLPTHSFVSIWRDLKVYDSHAFIVSEAQFSGLQVFDLRQLLTQKQTPHVFTETAFLGSFSSAHNIAINEETGFAYAVGTNTCSGGLHMVDIRNPAAPVDAGCYSGDGYTHDAQCVVYNGPDVTYHGRELCFASNEDTLTIVDVTDKAQPTQLARQTYAGVGYSHQGWLTADHRFFVADDELDEVAGAAKTTTYVWDVTDVANPVVDFTFAGATGAIDHNQYVRGNRSYQANYKAGLRIIDISGIDGGTASEVAYFDTFPDSNGPQFDGAWSSYPFYRANVIAVSTIDRGLFILGYADGDDAVAVADLDSRSSQPREDRWRATAAVEVRNGLNHPVLGATVTVRWANRKVRTCTTNDKGRCRVSVLRDNRFAKISYRIVDIDSGDAAYASWRNGDSDGDSNGLRHAVRRPAS